MGRRHVRMEGVVSKSAGAQVALQICSASASSRNRTSTAQDVCKAALASTTTVGRAAEVKMQSTLLRQYSSMTPVALHLQECHLQYQRTARINRQGGEANIREEGALSRRAGEDVMGHGETK